MFLYNLVPIENWLEEKTDMNFEERKQHIRSDWKFTRVVEKFKVGIEKNKLRRRRNVVEKYQSESKKFDAIDVGLYNKCVTFFNCLVSDALHKIFYSKITSIQETKYDFL